MPATPSRANTFTPPPSSGETGIMPDLYRLHVGPVNAAYYQQHFQRFEARGKATPTWNHGAAFFTLAWLLLRKLWRPAGIYAGLLAVLLAVWWWGIHGRVPATVEASLCLIAALVLCAVPGFLGNALYFHHVRQHTLETLTRATSLSQARVQLAEQATTKDRLHVISGAQALVSVAIAAAVFTQLDGLGARFRAPSAAPALAVGPPTLVIPPPSSVAPVELEAFTPTVALPEPVPVDSKPSAFETFAPVVPPQPVASAAAAATLSAVPAPAQPEAATTPSDKELSIVNLAQSVAAPHNAAATAVPPKELVASTPTPAPASKSKQALAPSKAAAPSPPAAVKLPPNTGTVTQRLQPGKFYLNAGVYAQTRNVDAAVKKLHAAKLTTLRQTLSSKNGDMTRLRVGPFDTRKQAEQAAAKMQKMQIPASVFQHPK